MKAQIPDESNCAPYQPQDILSLLENAPFKWWITGGWSIDLFLGKQTRSHFDIDVAIARSDQLGAQSYLRRWDFWSTRRDDEGDIILERWKIGHTLDRDIPGVWARESKDAPWRYEFLFQEISDGVWTFRYNNSVQHSLENIGGYSSENVSILLPEISLLLKAVRLQDVDEEDFQRVLPRLNLGQCEQLSIDLSKIRSNHQWLSALSGQRA